MSKFHCPVLVVHSRDDEIIPFHHGEAIFASANEPRTLLAIRGTHNDAFLRDERAYLEGLRAFLSGLPTAANPKLTADQFRSIDEAN